MDEIHDETTSCGARSTGGLDALKFAYCVDSSLARFQYTGPDIIMNDTVKQN